MLWKRASSPGRGEHTFAAFARLDPARRLRPESAMRFVVTRIVALVLTLGPSCGQASGVVGYDQGYYHEATVAGP